jgi:hypothetical protein
MRAAALQTDQKAKNAFCHSDATLTCRSGIKGKANQGE